MKECEKLLKYPRCANLAWSGIALHVPAQNRNTLLENADAIAELTTQIVQIPTAKILEIILVKVNANN
jgi:hypothetical protein